MTYPISQLGRGEVGLKPMTDDFKCNSFLFPMKLSRSQVCIPVQFSCDQRHPFQTFLHLTLTWNQFVPLDVQSEIRALESMVLSPSFCNLGDWKNAPIWHGPKNAMGIPREISPKINDCIYIHSQSWLSKWWESEIVKNPTRNKVLGQVHILYSQWLPSKCLVSEMERSFLNSGMVLSLGGATVPEVNKTQHEDYSVWVC